MEGDGLPVEDTLLAGTLAGFQLGATLGDGTRHCGGEEGGGGENDGVEQHFVGLV